MDNKKWNREASIRGLMMTRKEGEMISINNGEVLVEIVQVCGKYTRLCFQAAREISIVRLEKEPGREASATQPGKSR